MVIFIGTYMLKPCHCSGWKCFNYQTNPMHEEGNFGVTPYIWRKFSETSKFHNSWIDPYISEIRGRGGAERGGDGAGNGFGADSGRGHAYLHPLSNPQTFSKKIPISYPISKQISILPIRSDRGSDRIRTGRMKWPTLVGLTVCID